VFVVATLLWWIIPPVAALCLLMVALMAIVSRADDRLWQYQAPARNSREDLSTIHLERSDEPVDKVLARAVLAAQEQERRRIAEDFHEEVLQLLWILAVDLGRLEMRISDPDERSVVARSREGVQEAGTRLRQLIFEIGPVDLHGSGLEASVRNYLERNAPEAGLAIRFDDRLSHEPSADVAQILFRCAQESLRNVWKHSQATHVEVVLEDRGKGILLRVHDDGKGFAPEKFLGQPALGHVGLTLLRNRVALGGGRCQIRSRPGSGTTIACWLPDPRSAIPSTAAGSRNSG
jgi:signal transduction histidine kinase